MSVCKLTGGHGMLKNRKRVQSLKDHIFGSNSILFFTHALQIYSWPRVVIIIQARQQCAYSSVQPPVMHTNIDTANTRLLYTVLFLFFFFSLPGMASSKLLVCRGSVSLSSEAQTYHQCNTPPEALIRMRPAFLFYCGYVGFH